jgi:hypothetical protein
LCRCRLERCRARGGGGAGLPPLPRASRARRSQRPPCATPARPPLPRAGPLCPPLTWCAQLWALPALSFTRSARFALRSGTALPAATRPAAPIALRSLWGLYFLPSARTWREGGRGQGRRVWAEGTGRGARAKVGGRGYVGRARRRGGPPPLPCSGARAHLQGDLAPPLLLRAPLALLRRQALRRRAAAMAAAAAAAVTAALASAAAATPRGRRLERLELGTAPRVGRQLVLRLVQAVSSGGGAAAGGPGSGRAAGAARVVVRHGGARSSRLILPGMARWCAPRCERARAGLGTGRERIWSGVWAWARVERDGLERPQCILPPGLALPRFHGGSPLRAKTVFAPPCPLPHTDQHAIPASLPPVRAGTATPGGALHARRQRGATPRRGVAPGTARPPRRAAAC